MTQPQPTPSVNPLANLAQVILLQSYQQLPIPRRVNVPRGDSVHIELADLTALEAWASELTSRGAKLANDLGTASFAHRAYAGWLCRIFLSAEIPPPPPGAALAQETLDELAAVHP